jgi:hypothetical protein
MITNPTDAKLQRLAAAGLCAGSARDLVALGRLGDLATVPSGTVLREEGGSEPWSYCVLSGAALLSAGSEPVAVAGPGAWLVGRLPGRAQPASPVLVVSGGALELLAFRPAEADAALRLLRLSA